MVIALASHQCGPGSILRPGVISGLSLLLVLVLAPRVFCPGSLLLLALSNTSFSNSIPSSKKLIFANKSFFENPSNFDLISSISRTIALRNVCSVMSPSLGLSTALSLPLSTRKPTEALKTAVKNRIHHPRVNDFQLPLFLFSVATFGRKQRGTRKGTFWS